MTTPGFHRLRIASLRHDTADSVVLGFAVPAELRAAFRFTPGQFVTLRAMIDGRACRRSYSICSDPEAAEVQVGIRHLPGGRFSGFAATALKVGDTLEVMPPDGRFGLAPEPGARRNLLFCAAGAGITPSLSILRATLARESGRCTLLYANRTRAAIMFREEIDALKDRYLDRFALVHLLSRETVEGALAGRLDGPTLARLCAGPAAGPVDHAFLCGPEGFAAALAPALAALGGQLHQERFVPAEDAAARTAAAPAETDAPAAWAEVTYQGVRTRIPLAAGENIIAAGERAGLELPHACRGGMCCTCRAMLTAGKVSMATNYSLEPWEIAAGYVLTCQASAASAELAVDYDRM
ncbi:MAG: 2Fe-2S iron-sulfur cluster-binding protein [Acetobacteraceae bacterium]